ncbi:hypothetical protein ACWDG9_17065 [Streptomyces sp. NPDC001073]
MNESLMSVAAMTDPVKRFEAARAASDAVAAQYGRIAGEAAQQLVAGHHGNVAAAAAELGMTPPGLHKILKGADPAARPARTPAVQAQPALRFSTPEDAEDALRDWRLRRQSVDDALEQLLLGALAVGVDPIDVSQLTDVPLANLRRIRPAGNIAVSALESPCAPDEVLGEFARRIDAHADAVKARAATAPERSAAKMWRLAADAVIANTAPYVRYPSTVHPDDFDDAAAFAEAFVAQPGPESRIQQPDPDLVVSGPDAWLAVTYVQYTRMARERLANAVTAPGGEEDSGEPPHDEAAHDEAMNDALTAIAAAILHVRTTGTVPLLDSEGGAA